MLREKKIGIFGQAGNTIKSGLNTVENTFETISEFSATSRDSMQRMRQIIISELDQGVIETRTEGAILQLDAIALLVERGMSEESAKTHLFTDI